MTSLKTIQFSRTPTPLDHLSAIFVTLLTLDIQFQMTPSGPLQMITNQFKDNIIQRWLLYVIRSFLQVGFRFQYQPINLFWFSFDFNLFSWSALLYLLLRGFILLCVRLSKNINKCLLFIIIHVFSTPFAINLFSAQLKNLNILRNNSGTVRMN